MDVVVWLRSLRLGKYEALFRRTTLRAGSVLNAAGLRHPPELFWTLSSGGMMMRSNPEFGRRHGRRGLAAEPGPWKV